MCCIRACFLILKRYTISIIFRLILNSDLVPLQIEQQKQKTCVAAVILKTLDLKEGIKQHADQQNTLQRGDDCRQADEGQQQQGKGNEAKGFNDKSNEFCQNPVIVSSQY